MKTMMLACVALASSAMASAVLAQAAPAADSMFQATTLAVSADGQSKITPDQATITLGVQVTDATAQAAMQDDAQSMTGVMAALRAAGIPDKDVQTSNISLEAQYTYVQNQPPKLTGYQASNDVTITVEDLARLGPVIDAVTAAARTR